MNNKIKRKIKMRGEKGSSFCTGNNVDGGDNCVSVDTGESGGDGVSSDSENSVYSGDNTN